MRHAVDWFAEDPTRRAAPWVVIGKGPTFALRDRLLPPGHRLLGLNHVCDQVGVDLTHVTDLDVLWVCGGKLRYQGGFLVMPYYPHTNSKPGRKNLHDLLKAEPVLKDMERAGRLLWYRSSLSAALFHPDDDGDDGQEVRPAVRVRFFSAVAAVNLLGGCGVKVVRSLGVDGGKAYAPEFAKLRPLGNGRSGFDIQFGEIHRAVKAYGLDYARLAPPPEKGSS